MKVKDYKDQVKKLYEYGYTYRQMSAVLPFCAETLKYCCNTMIKNGELEPKPRANTNKKQLVCDAYTMGETDYETLSRRFGIAVSTVQQYLSKLKRGKTISERSRLLAIELATTEYTPHTIPALAKKYNFTKQYAYYILKNFEHYISGLGTPTQSLHNSPTQNNQHT